jgi:hypothetical protein
MAWLSQYIIESVSDKVLEQIFSNYAEQHLLEEDIEKREVFIEPSLSLIVRRLGRGVYQNRVFQIVDDVLSVTWEEGMSDIACCPYCGSGDITFCEISVRPYCRECKYWGAINLTGTKEDAIRVWNNHSYLWSKHFER